MLLCCKTLAHRDDAIKVKVIVLYDTIYYDVVVAHCYVVQYRRIDCVYVLYAADEGLRGRNVLQSVVD